MNEFIFVETSKRVFWGNGIFKNKRIHEGFYNAIFVVKNTTMWGIDENSTGSSIWLDKWNRIGIASMTVMSLFGVIISEYFRVYELS